MKKSNIDNRPSPVSIVNFPDDGYILTRNDNSTNSSNFLRNLNVETRSITKKSRLMNDIKNETLFEIIMVEKINSIHEEDN